MAQPESLLRASGPKAGALLLIGLFLWSSTGLAYTAPRQEAEVASPPTQEAAQGVAAADSLPPTGSIAVPVEQRITHQPEIRLLLKATDTQSAVDSMQFSTDGRSWTPPEPYRPTRTWELTGGDGVKTIFVRFRDRSGNWMKEPVSVTVTLDRQPPQNPSMVVNEGRAITNQRQVALKLFAEGASEVQVSEDSAFTDAAWLPLRETSSFTLTPEEGSKTLYARFRDRAGNLSDVVSGHILLDTTPPLDPMVRVNEGARFTNDRRVQVRLSAKEAVEMKVAEGSLESAAWQPYDSLMTIDLTGPEGERTVLATFRDFAGNETVPVQATIVLDQTPPQNPQIVIAGGRDFVNGAQVLLGLSAEGAAEMLLRGDFVATGADTGWIGYRSQMPVQLTAGEGAKSLSVRFRDEAGNLSEEAVAEVVLDLTPPKISEFRIDQVQPRAAALIFGSDEVTRARIKLIGEDPEDVHEFSDSTFSDRHQVPLFGLLPGTGYRVLLTAIDRAENTTQAAELSFVTLSETVVQARVFFPHTRIPVVGVKARLGDIETESDELGSFQFVHPPVGELPFVLEKDGFASYDTTLSIPKTGKLEEEVELASDLYTHAITGRVTDRHGQPLAATRVSLFNPDGSESDLVAVADDSGRFVLDGVPQGERQIRVYADYFEPVEPVLNVTADMRLDEKLAAAPILPPERMAAVTRSIRSIGIEWEPIRYPTNLGYIIYRAPAGDSTFVAIHEGYLPPSQETYVDSGLAIGASYTYALAVVNTDTVVGKRSRKVAAATLKLFTPNQALVGGLERQISHAAPFLADLDGDGDLDLLMAEGTGAVRGYRNIGSASLPRWKRDDTLARGTLRVGGNSRVVLADLDADGDLDLLRGIGDGRFRAYRNTGSTESPQWKPDAELSEGVKDDGRNLSPALADLDGDGDYDLMIGTYRPEVLVYQNLGEPDRPVWKPTDGFGAGLENLPLNVCPVFADLDGDGDQDLLIGEGLGTIIAFENIGSPQAPKWRLSTQFSTGLSDVGDQAVPTLGDLDGDGDLDLLVGSWNGKVFGFENNTIASVRVLAGVKALK